MKFPGIQLQGLVCFLGIIEDGKREQKKETQIRVNMYLLMTF
mgnify:FL=1